jgi:pimeloyl-ACP methyl ester carboxylesterase
MRGAAAGAEGAAGRFSAAFRRCTGAMPRPRMVSAFLVGAALAGAALVSAALASAARAEPVAVPAIEWTACDWLDAGETRCGYLVVPERRDDAEAGRAAGAVVRVFFALHPPTGSGPAAPDPVVVLPGGPGGLFNPPVPYVTGGLAALARDRAVIVVDQRGIGRSRPRLVCDGGETGTGRRAADDCARRLADAGVDPSAYNSLETARDLADLRRALGVRSWNAVGASYASRVLHLLALVDPEGTRSVVLMASLPLAPALARRDLAGLGAALRAELARACAEDAACHEAYGDLAARLAAIEAAIARGAALTPESEAAGLRWVLADLERRSGGFARALVRRMDRAGDIRFLPRDIAALHDIVHGRRSATPAGLRALYGGGEGLASPLPPIDWASLTGFVIRCREDVLPGLAAGTAARRTQPSLLACADFAAIAFPKPPPGARVGAGLPPVLILTGAYDVRTPSAWSDEIALDLPGAVLVRLGDIGHDLSYRHPCANALMTAFVVAPTAPLDTACALGHRRPKFEIGPKG